MLSLTSLVIRWYNSLMRMFALSLVMAVFAGLLSQTVFAQNTYVITDGDQVTVHTSYASDPGEVLEEAGFRLDADDFYIAQPTDGGSEITVQRAQSIFISYCGRTVQANSYGESLQSLLNRLGLFVDEEYRSTVELETATYDGMQVSIDHVVRVTEPFTEEIPYETTVLYDPTLPEGQTVQLVAGEAGLLTGSASVVYINSREQSRIVLEESVRTAPVAEVLAVGTGAAGDEARPVIGAGVIHLPSGEQLTYHATGQFTASAYNKEDEGCGEWTATGTRVREGVVAVDPDVIPYGTRMFILSNDGAYVYGVATAEDCGSSIQGNRIDLYYDSLSTCWQFGRRECTVFFLDEAK